MSSKLTGFALAALAAGVLWGTQAWLADAAAPSARLAQADGPRHDFPWAATPLPAAAEAPVPAARPVAATPVAAPAAAESAQDDAPPAGPAALLRVLESDGPEGERLGALEAYASHPAADPAQVRALLDRLATEGSPLLAEQALMLREALDATLPPDPAAD